MVRLSNPRKDQKKNQNESNDPPLKPVRKEKSEKYRHKNNWLEEEDDDDFDEILEEEDDDDFDEKYLTKNKSAFDEEE
ncbi:MAG: hypothetical protein AB8F94_12095 [Saprospiraceae bacterium]